MNNQEIIALHDEYVMGTYGRFSVVLCSGKGSTYYDFDNKKYIDFTSGIGVNSLGAADDEWISAVTEQLKNISHVSNYFYSLSGAKLAEKLVNLAKMSKVFFANSGCEANEGAIKLARKYSFDKFGKGRATILTLKDSFHGRTISTLSATGQDNFHDYFFPFTEGFKYINRNDIAEFTRVLDEDKSVCAIFIEPIQGESGVNFIDKEYMKEVAEICNKRDILLMFDEVQTGVARTGKMFAHEYFGIQPDILSLAKGLGGGLPIGAFLCNDKLKNVLDAGKHGSTFGGNPTVCAGALNVVERVSTPEFLSEINKKGEYIKQKISEFDSKNIVEIRQKGLMIGVQVNDNRLPKDYAKACLNKGLLVLTAGSDVVRFLPPLNISLNEIDEGLAILREVL